MHLLRRLYWLVVRLPVLGPLARRLAVAVRAQSRQGLPDTVGQMVEVHNHLIYTIADGMLNVREALDQAVDGGRAVGEIEERLLRLEAGVQEVRAQLAELDRRSQAGPVVPLPAGSEG